MPGFLRFYQSSCVHHHFLYVCFTIRFSLPNHTLQHSLLFSERGSLLGSILWTLLMGPLSFSHSASERLWGSPIICWILQWNVNKGKNTNRTVFIYCVSLSFSKNVQLFILYLSISHLSIGLIFLPNFIIIVSAVSGSNFLFFRFMCLC